MAPPALPFIVGSGRSGTTLVGAIFDSHPELAVAFEAHFVAALGQRRQRYERDRRFAVEAFVADLFADKKFRRLGLTRPEVSATLTARPPCSFADAVRSVLAIYARRQGKARYGDKTPGYALRIPLLAGLFPEARFVHVIRDGRDVAAAFADVSFGPRSQIETAMYWKQYVTQARRAGARLGKARYREVRYESLVDDPEGVVRELCPFLDLEFDESMLHYFERPLSTPPDHPEAHGRLSLPPTRGRRDWRRELSDKQLAVFEAAAGDVLEDLGYQRAIKATSPQVQAQAGLGWLHWQGRRASARARGVVASRRSRFTPLA